MLWVTEIQAIKPSTGELRIYCGPHVPGISLADAQQYCEQNGLGYCRVIGRLIGEIPCKAGTYEPDYSKAINYEAELLN